MNKELNAKIFELIEKHDPINNRNLYPTRSDPKSSARDFRLPIPGTTVHKEYKDKKHTILVLKDGFEHENKRYKSLSAIAKKITGSHWNGYGFFGLEKR
ncbi:MAG: DUF2924 domain-containing protein [Candidatus Omnitrophica bacterium]|nr:DUF2924 domain-containing protein [Candidatus Omnitrophota bacterium]